MGREQREDGEGKLRGRGMMGGGRRGAGGREQGGRPDLLGVTAKKSSCMHAVTPTLAFPIFQNNYFLGSV